MSSPTNKQSGALFYAKNIKGGSETVTVRLNGVAQYPGLGIYIFEYKGVDINSPLDGNAQAAGSSSSVSSGNLAAQCRGNYSLDSVFRIRRAPRAPYLSGTTNDASSSSIAQAFPTANVSGNLIVSAISWDSNASVTCSDSQSNSYAVATTQYDSVNNQSLAICYAANVKSGTNTVTATFSSFSEYRRLLIHEYKGIASVNPLDVVAKNVANGTIETLL